ncbi:molecular chaperone DnaJ [Vespertiliibacter pulmonis]|uniref:phospholipase D n=1 Tax=Vespertiliibacter pulmonis TaxID=1443036 RepID=A0A3N4W499_9PAST|nr:phospholipase D-like domain-containing protein [Vespertiliibacter pulmonis]QLB21571.1 molecular chaperone DnaJ [Vespertiliibacter pulmonis]RPE85991.1 DnaJ-like protein [Vespertiliibacter pulmonis]
MKTEAIFEQIAQRIEQELLKAEQTIYIAVAWLTNRGLYQLLVDKAMAGVTVQLLVSNDKINRNSGIDFSLLQRGNSGAYLIGNSEQDLMHNKFCVVDRHIVITGSYNWSYKAEKHNHENIVITTDDFQLADQFIAQFKHIRDSYVTHCEQQEFPVAKIIKRLEILKNYVILEDEEDIERESHKLQLYAFQQDIEQIITALRQNAFAQAVSLIDEFVRKHHQLTIYNDVEISALKLEIRHLEHQLNAYDDEKTELERTLSQFQHRHSKELGSRISRLLHLRKLKFKFINDEAQFSEAEQDEREYNEQLAEENQKHIFELTETEKKELKRSYKKASILCHPDKVSDEMKEMAAETFNRLKQAYEENDLAKVNEILSELEQGNFFKSRADTLNEKDKLKIAIQKLKTKISQLEAEIFAIKEAKNIKPFKTLTIGTTILLTLNSN